MVKHQIDNKAFSFKTWRAFFEGSAGIFCPRAAGV
jgi:hypothetical protein